MKLKKLKLLVKAVANIAAAKEIQGIQPAPFETPMGKIMLLPTRGKYVTEDIKTINKIIMSIEPKDLVEEARKINLQAGGVLMSVFTITPINKMVVVHTPKGWCVYNAILNESEEIKPKISVDVDESLMDKIEVL